MALQTSAGTRFQVSASLPATEDQAGYEAVSGWLTVGEIVNLGSIGREYTLITHAALDSRATRKFKGTYNEGSLALQLGQDLENAGQTLLDNTVESDDRLACVIIFPNGARRYFLGLPMSFTDDVGGPDQIIGATCNMEVDGRSVKVAAP